MSLSTKDRQITNNHQIKIHKIIITRCNFSNFYINTVYHCLHASVSAVTMKFVVCLSVLFILLVNGSNGYRILGVFPAPAYSHFSLASRLMKALAENGHDVTIIAPFPEKSPPKNYREIVLEGLKETVDGKESTQSLMC